MKSKQIMVTKGESINKMAEAIDVLFDAYLNDVISSEDEDLLFDVIATDDFDEVLAIRIESELVTAMYQHIESQTSVPLLGEKSVVPDRQPMPILVTWRSYMRQHPIVFPQSRQFLNISCSLFVADPLVYQDTFETIQHYLRRINKNFESILKMAFADILRDATLDRCSQNGWKFEIMNYSLVVFPGKSYCDLLEASEANGQYWQCIKPLYSGLQRKEDDSPVYGPLLTYEEVVANSNLQGYLCQGSYNICTQMTSATSLIETERNVSLILTKMRTKVKYQPTDDNNSPDYGPLLTYEQVVANSNFGACWVQRSHNMCSQMTDLTSYNKNAGDMSTFLTSVRRRVQYLLSKETTSSQHTKQVVNTGWIDTTLK